MRARLNCRDSQQIILTGQQTSRQLLGVLLQDNFNLKEENTRLRERMVENERKVFELKRELDEARSQERERMRQMEAHLFEVQRRLDSMAQRRSAQHQPQAMPLPDVPTPMPNPAYQIPQPVQEEQQEETPPVESVVPASAVPESEAVSADVSQPDDVAEESVTGEPQGASTRVRGLWHWLLGK